LKNDISLYEFDITDESAFTDVELNFGESHPLAACGDFRHHSLTPVRHNGFIAAGFLTLRPIRAI
jgi:hypothetical protein